MGMLNPKYCYICATPLIYSDPNSPTCKKHGILWPLFRNAPCAEAFIIRDDGSILLIKRGSEPMKGYWAVPGGFCEYGEHPRKTAIREAAEETGWRIQLRGILGVYLDSFPGNPDSEHRLVVSYLASPVKRDQQPDQEATEQAWFQPNDLPDKLIPVQTNRFKDYAERLKADRAP